MWKKFLLLILFLFPVFSYANSPIIDGTKSTIKSEVIAGVVDLAMNSVSSFITDSAGNNISSQIKDKINEGIQDRLIKNPHNWASNKLKISSIVAEVVETAVRAVIDAKSQTLAQKEWSNLLVSQIKVGCYLATGDTIGAAMEQAEVATEQLGKAFVAYAEGISDGKKLNTSIRIGNVISEEAHLTAGYILGKRNNNEMQTTQYKEKYKKFLQEQYNYSPAMIEDLFARVDGNISNLNEHTISFLIAEYNDGVFTPQEEINPIFAPFAWLIKDTFIRPIDYIIDNIRNNSVNQAQNKTQYHAFFTEVETNRNSNITQSPNLFV
jgi:hypothetical protein